MNFPARRQVTCRFGVAVNDRKIRLRCSGFLIALALFAPSPKPVFAQTAPTLGTAQSFAVLGASTVTNTGPTMVNGNLGVSPGTAVTGFPPGVVTPPSTIHAADAVAAQAQADANTAYNSLASQACNTILTGQDLGGLTLTPGVYCFAATAQLTGTLTLNGQGNPNAVFIFQIGSAITTASNAKVSLINGAVPCNVFFQVGSSATLGTGTQFIGNILALASVTLTTNSTVAGRAIGLTGAVTLDSNVVSVQTCNVLPPTGFVQVCKVAGAGVTVGTNFTFSVGGTPVTVAAGAAPGGTCSAAMVAPAGPIVITETLPTGTTLTSVSTLPAGALVSSNLAAGTATVTVTASGTTIATFLDTVIPVVPTTGFVQVCKIAGAGVAVGTNFTFNVGGTSVTVAAGPAPGGTCSTPIVETAGPVVIAETLPSGTTLTSVSTVPAGLLVSSNLAAGTATVTVNAGGQTIATFLDTVIPVVPTTGFVQVCKVAGAGVAVGTNFTFSVAGTPVTVAAGPAPGGTCSAAIVVPAGANVITETLPSGTTLTSVSTLPAGLLVSSNLATGTATVTVNAGGQTIATFLDTVIPVIPTTGFVQVCKVAGAGVAVGTNFTFNVGGTSITVAAGPAPGGTCSTPIVETAGPIMIVETLPSGTTLTSVSTLPAGLLVSSDLAGGTAIVTVNAGGQTIATFLDTVVPVIPTTGFVQVCKIAGAGVAVGTNFTFSVGGTSVTVAAGAAPGGTCSTPIVVPAGPTTVTETLPSGTTLTSVSTLPAGLLVSSNLPAGTAVVTVNAGGQTIATFLDTVVPVIPTTGLLQICKVAGGGVPVGTNFSFNVAGTTVTVPAGQAPGGTCSAAIVVPAGATIVTETLPSGIALTSVSTLPPGLLVSSNLATGTATVTVNAGGQTIATFLDTMIPVIPTTGEIQICKVAGGGVAPGTNFTFDVGGTSITVPAGPAPGGSCSPAMVVPAGPIVVKETLPTGIALTSVITLPAGLLVSSNLATGTATVTVNAGGQTIATFLDSLIPVIPTTGFLQICKVAGGGVAVGTNFTFSVAGMPITVPAGAAPGGSCSPAIIVPAGATVVTETLPTGTVLTSVSTLPDGLLMSSNLATGSATVMVTAGGLTIATFLDTVSPTTGIIQICKVAGGGVTVGTNFTFIVGSTLVTVPAGSAPGGSCSQPLTVAAGPTIVTETLPSGTVLTSVSTLPSGLLVSSNLAAGTATVTVTAGGQTIVTFLNTMIPIIQMTGTLQICKVAGPGVPVGTNFAFNIAGISVTVPAGAGPGGSCSTPLVLPAGATLVSETLPTGTTLTSVTTLPAGSLISSNLATGTATVTVTAGAHTVATFTNTMIATATGLLKICKVAGPGVTVGTQFSFTVGSTTLSVPAGFCAIAGTFPVGTQLTATETIPAGNQVTAITVLPADRLLSAPNLTAGSVAFTIGTGVTEVGFTNSSGHAVELGLLKVCKIAGTGVTTGTNFTFVISGASFTVPAGFCVDRGALPVGTVVTITETFSSGTAVSAISVLPADRQGMVDLTARAVSATIGAGVTEVSFTNSGSHAVELGLLKVCKIAGTGVATGTNFTFVISGASFTVPAGFCVDRGALPVGTVVTITEMLSSGTAVSAISVLPADRQGMVDLTARAVTATIGAGVTEVSFTNSSSHAVELGVLKVCKIAGTGVATGTNFTFVISGASFDVPAGFCVDRTTLPVGTVVTITEMLSSGTAASAISVLPADRQGVVDLSARAVTATIGAGVTEVSFTNVATR